MQSIKNDVNFYFIFLGCTSLYVPHLREQIHPILVYDVKNNISTNKKHFVFFKKAVRSTNGMSQTCADKQQLMESSLSCSTSYSRTLN
jgi:hypothetical protein